MPKTERQPTLGGLLNFVQKGSADEVDLFIKVPRVKKSSKYAIGTVIRTTGHEHGLILSAEIIDDIVETFKTYAVQFGYSTNTISTYGSDFRTTAIMYYRWHNNDPSWDDGMRRTRTISGCDVHPEPVFYGTELSSHHIKLSSGIETTLKLPNVLDHQDAKRIIDYISMLVHDTSS